MHFCDNVTENLPNISPGAFASMQNEVESYLTPRVRAWGGLPTRNVLTFTSPQVCDFDGGRLARQEKSLGMLGHALRPPSVIFGTLPARSDGRTQLRFSSLIS